MANFLERNKIDKIRATIGNDIILYNPNNIQFGELKDIIKKQDLKLNNDGEIEGEVTYQAIRYIIKNLCKDGEFIDEYTDEQLEEYFDCDYGKLHLLFVEIKSIIEDVVNSIIEDNINELKFFNASIKAFKFNKDVEKSKAEFDKFAKKYKLNITFDEILNGGYSKEEIVAKLSKDKTKK